MFKAITWAIKSALFTLIFRIGIRFVKRLINKKMHKHDEPA